MITVELLGVLIMECTTPLADDAVAGSLFFGAAPPLL